MPPRYAYWTIIAGGLPTAFRASEREDLLPTFARLREKHPDAEMKWFARGRLWDSPEAARRDRERAARNLARPRGGDRSGEPKRGRDWRPGGDHRDPRQQYVDAKKERNQARRRAKFAHRHGGHEGQPEGQRPPEGRRERERPQQGHTRRPAGADGFRRDARQPKPTWKTSAKHGFRQQPRGDSFRESHEGRKPQTPGKRPFDRRGFLRGQGTEEPVPPPRPRDPDREPRPSETPEPSQPPPPQEPVMPPPGPPERGRAVPARRSRGGGGKRPGRP